LALLFLQPVINDSTHFLTEKRASASPNTKRKVKGGITLNENKVIDLVQAEKDRQLNKWGESNYSPYLWHAVLSEEVGEVAQELVNYSLTNDIQRLKDARKELIQVAAVAISFVESMDRNELSQ
jgi:NTP pyrophosphatase (non-canonical NTP hydrolase)